MALNWLDALKGALAGAGTGAGLGSFASPLGTALGGAGGGIIGFLTSLLGNNQDDIQQVQNVTPEVQNILQFLLQQGKNGLENPYEGFDDIKNQAQNQFSQETVPGLAERFTSLGNNALSSGAFTSQLGQAGAGLQQNLSGLKQQYGMQNKQNALQQLQLGMQPSFSNVQRQGFGDTAISGLFQAAPQLYKAYNKNQALKNMPKP